MTDDLNRPVLRDLTYRTGQVVGVIGKKSAMLDHALTLSKAKNPVSAGAAFFVLQTDVALSALGTTKAIAGRNNKDLETFNRMENYISAVASCGGTILFVLASPFSGGTTAFLGVLSGAACANDVAKLVYFETTGEELFQSRQAKAFELGIETLGLFASVSSMGFKHAGKAATWSARMWYQGFSTASKMDKFSVGLEATGLGIKSFDYLLEFGGAPIPKQLSPTPTNISESLESVGICRPNDFIFNGQFSP